MSVLTAQPSVYMTPSSTRNLAVSFVNQLAGGDLLTGTPTVAISSGGPTLSAAAVNSAPLKIELPLPGEHWAKAGQAVTFTAAASATAAATYTVTITCSTSGGQVLQGYMTIVVATS